MGALLLALGRRDSYNIPYQKMRTDGVTANRLYEEKT